MFTLYIKYVSRMYLFAELDREMETENEKLPTT